jgi:hypothetical protein
MKKLSAVLLAALIGGVACKDLSSPQASPAIAPPQSGSNALSFRPPPPLASEMDGTVASTSFQIGITYFMNGPENNGWISFNKTQLPGISLSSPSARITIHQGTLSGTGTLTIYGNVVDLATGLGTGNFSTACSAGATEVGTVTTGDFGGGDRQGCGSFTFTTTKGETGFAVISPGFRVVTSGQ